MSIDHDGGSLNVDSTVGNSTSPVNRAGYGLNVDDGNKTHYDGSSFLNQSYGSEIGSILMWAFDADNGKLYISKNKYAAMCFCFLYIDQSIYQHITIYML